MTSATLQNQIEEAIPVLLNIAKELTWNKFSDNYKFILTEIKNNEENFHIQRRLAKKENDLKIPVTLQELLPTLENLYDDFYDINLQIYKATKDLTTIDFRYYPRSSLDTDFRQKALHNQPMFHCKVSMPPWLTDKKEKFDINWEHREVLTKWKLFWTRLKLKNQKHSRMS
jgi:hypothetical protein